MNCERLRLAVTDDPDDPPAAARVHIGECAACRAWTGELREGLLAARSAVAHLRDEDVPPVDIAALLREADVQPTTGSAPFLRLAARAAAVVLATIGVLALFGSRVEAAEGTVRVSFALPGAAGVEPAPDAAESDTAEVLRALDADDPQSALRRAMKHGLVPLAEWLDEREARDSERLDELVAYVRGTHRQELLALRSELDLMRVELDASRDRFATLSRPPALPSAD